jgi:hypothetical protein
MELTSDRRTTERAEQVLVHDRRLTQLLRAGFELEDAAVLARYAEVDLHRALGLVQHGCPTTIAVRILL